MFSLITLIFVAFTQIGLSQEPPHPPSEKGTDTNHGPAGAPVDPGTGIFLILAGVYGLRKIYDVRKKLTE